MSKLTTGKNNNITKATPRSEDVSIISLAWDLGWMIAVPIVLLAFGGAVLDKKLQTSPWFLLGGIGLAFVISAVMVYGKVMRVMEDLSVNGKLLEGEEYNSD